MNVFKSLTPYPSPRGEVKGRKGVKGEKWLTPTNLLTRQLVSRITILDFVLLRLHIALFGLVGWDTGNRGLRSTCVGCWQGRVQ